MITSIDSPRVFIFRAITKERWIEFVYLPSYAPELNPVELYWNHMKHVLMSNFVLLSSGHLESKTLEATQVINKDPELIKKFCKHAQICL